MVEQLVVGEAATSFIPTAATEYSDIPDTMIDHGSIGALHFRAASVRGYSHRYSPDNWSVPRQDSYCFRVSKDGRWFVAVVCDGVGSGQWSQYAALVAARSCSGFVIKQLSDNPDLEDINWDLVVRKTSQSIVREYFRRSKDSSDFNEETAPQLMPVIIEKMATTAVAVVIDLVKNDLGQQVEGAGEKNSPDGEELDEEIAESNEGETPKRLVDSLPSGQEESSIGKEGEIFPCPDIPNDYQRVQESKRENNFSEDLVEGGSLGSFYSCKVVNLAGDSSIWKLGSEGWYPLLTEKKLDTAIASNSVNPLPLSSKPHVSSVELYEGESIFLMTDGVGDPFHDGSGELGNVLKECWATPPNPYQFASDIDFNRRSYDDDRTVVGIWNLSGEEETQ